jgi:peptide-methionine (S)-S-oxide reductase
MIHRQAQRKETELETPHRDTDRSRTELATFGAGCFWQVEMAFRGLPGVLDTAVGYEGGHVEHPSYEQVCSHTTGHAEVCQVEFDPERISYEELLEAFWGVHDPTQLNRQGPDVGDQYRSVIFTHSTEQEKAATRSKAHVQERFRDPVVTVIEPAKPFWRAEEYHQCYLQKRPSASGFMGMLLGR